MIAKHRDDGVWDTDDAPASLGLGRAEEHFPVDRSTYAARNLTVRAFRSRSQRRNAATPHPDPARVTGKDLVVLDRGHQDGTTQPVGLGRSKD